MIPCWCATILIVILMRTSSTEVRYTPQYTYGPCDTNLGKMYASNITASSMTEDNKASIVSLSPHATVDHKYGWCPTFKNTTLDNEWIQLEFPSMFRILWFEYNSAKSGSIIGERDQPKKILVEYQRTKKIVNKWYKALMSEPSYNLNDKSTFIARRIRITAKKANKKWCFTFIPRGCVFQDNILSYILTKLDKDTDNDLRDLKYDHKPNMSKLKYRLSGGLGKLTDGQYGQHKNLYVGWRAPKNNKSIDIILKFDSLRNFSSLIIYCSNATSNHCPARFNIQTAIKNSKYNSKEIKFIIEKSESESPSILRIPLQNLIGRFMIIRMWPMSNMNVWLSEIKVQSELGYLQRVIVPKTIITSTTTYGKTIGKTTVVKSTPVMIASETFSEQLIGAFIGFVAIFVIIMLFVMIFCYRRKRKQRHCLPEYASSSSTSSKMYVPQRPDIIYKSAPQNSDVLYNSNDRSGATTNHAIYFPNNSNSSGDLQNSLRGRQHQHKMASPMIIDNYTHTIGNYDNRSTMQARKLPEVPNSGDYDVIPDLSTLPLMIENHSTNETFALPLQLDTSMKSIINVKMGPVECNAVGSMIATRPLNMDNIDDHHVSEENILVKEQWGPALELCAVNEQQCAGHYIFRKGLIDVADNEIQRYRETLDLLRCLDHKNIVCFAFDTDTPSGQLPHYALEWSGENLYEFLQLDHSGTDYKNTPSLILIASEIAEGMHYLEYKGVIHRDLAARNCSIDRRTLQVKIGDYARMCVCFKDDYCNINDESSQVPVRWIAWESLLDNEYTHKSDVWSFAVTVWEVFTSKRPFVEFSSNFDLIDHISATNHSDITDRLVQPCNMQREVYQLMKQCWSYPCESRPNFYEISMFLGRKTEGYAPMMFNR